MRAILAIATTSVALVGCGSLGSSSGLSDPADEPVDNGCETVVTKTGVVEQC